MDLLISQPLPRAPVVLDDEILLPAENFALDQEEGWVPPGLQTIPLPPPDGAAMRGLALDDEILQPAEYFPYEYEEGWKQPAIQIVPLPPPDGWAMREIGFDDEIWPVNTNLPPTFGSATTGDSGGGTTTTLTIGKPTNTALNSFLLAQIAVDSTVRTVTAPGGWNFLRKDANTGGNPMQTWIFWHPCGNGEPLSYNFAIQSPGAPAAGEIARFENVDLLNPIDQHGGQTNTATANVTGPSLTPFYTNDMLVWLGSSPSGAGTFTPVTGMTDILQDNAQPTIDMNYLPLTTNAATGTKTGIFSVAENNVGQTVLLKGTTIGVIQDDVQEFFLPPVQYGPWLRTFVSDDEIFFQSMPELEDNPAPLFAVQVVWLPPADTPTSRRAAFFDDEITGKFQQFGLEDEAAWPQLVTFIPPTTQAATDDEILRPAENFALDDTEWTAFVQTILMVPQSAVFTDDEILRPTELFANEQEEFFLPAMQFITWVARPALDDEATPVNQPREYEDFWTLPLVQVVWLPPVDTANSRDGAYLDDEILQPTEKFALEYEDAWPILVQAVPWLPRPALDDEILQPTLEFGLEDEAAWPVLTQTIVWQDWFATDDEILQPTEKFTVTEDDTWTSAVQAIVFTGQVAIDDELIHQITGITEDAVSVTATQANPWALIVALDDEIIAKSFGVEEELSPYVVQAFRQPDFIQPGSVGFDIRLGFAQQVPGFSCSGSIICDTFTDANGTALASHTPDKDVPGNPWVQQSGSIQIQGNKAQWISGSGIATINAGVSDVSDIEADMSPGNNLDICGMVLRFTDLNNYWLIELNSGSNSNSGLWERNGGVWFQRIAFTTSYAIGQVVAVSATLSGQTISIKIGANSGSYTAAALNQTSTLHGISLDSNSSETADNFKIVPFVTDDESFGLATPSVWPSCCTTFPDDEILAQIIHIESEDNWTLPLVQFIAPTKPALLDDEILRPAEQFGLDQEEPWLAQVQAIIWLAPLNLDDETWAQNLPLDLEDFWTGPPAQSVLWSNATFLDDEILQAITVFGIDQEDAWPALTQYIAPLPANALYADEQPYWLPFGLEQEEFFLPTSQTVTWQAVTFLDDEIQHSTGAIDIEAAWPAMVQAVPWLSFNATDDEANGGLGAIVSDDDTWTPQAQTITVTGRVFSDDEAYVIGLELEDWFVPLAVQNNAWLPISFADDEIAPGKQFGLLEETAWPALVQTILWLPRFHMDDEIVSTLFFGLETESAWPVLTQANSWTARPFLDDETTHGPVQFGLEDEAAWPAWVQYSAWSTYFVRDDEIIVSLLSAGGAPGHPFIEAARGTVFIEQFRATVFVGPAQNTIFDEAVR